MEREKIEIDSPDSNADAAARSGDPTQVIKAAAELGDEVRGLSGVCVSVMPRHS